MKTLIFCTTWANSDNIWLERYGKWLEAIRQSPLKRAQILMVDDASPCLPAFADMIYLDADKLPAQYPTADTVFVRFQEGLGRKALCDYPGWWRSFMFAAKYATRYGFDKIIHIESDSFLLSTSIIEHVNALQTGWVSFWCPKWHIPETSIQVICADQLPHYYAYAQQSYTPLIGKLIENLLPFTWVECNFKGDRYGEYRTELPLDADYASQITPSTKTWCGVSPPPRQVIALTLSTTVIPPLHPLLYPMDAWAALPPIATKDCHALLEALDHLPLASLDAIQLTIPYDKKPVPYFLIEYMLPWLTPGGELVMHLRDNENSLETLEEAMNPLLKSGNCSVGLKIIHAGSWIMIVEEKPQLLPQNVRNRITDRLALLE